MDALLFRSPKIGRLLGVDLLLHWTMWFLPIFILVRGSILYPTDEAFLQFILVFGVYASVLVHECGQLLVARWLGLGIREIKIYPIGGVSRLAVLSDRPWKEVWVATAGPVSHFMIAGLIALGFFACDKSLTPRLDVAQPFAEVFANRLFWLNVLLAVLQIVPAFPLDGGFIFRGALALSVQRLRATEVAALLTSFVALLVLIPGMVWMSSVWWLILLGIVIHVSGQQEVMIVRYFASLQNPIPGMVNSAPILVPEDQLLDAVVMPDEPNFSGMIWNPKNRLWIVWRNGQPVSANALVGE